VDVEFVTDKTWAHRMDNYKQRAKAESGHALQWMQLVFMLIAVSLGTFALLRTLRSALNKDTLAMRSLNR